MPTNKPQRLPDAMPDVDKPTLLVVCDNHHCKFIDVGNHTLLVAETIDSREPNFTDKAGRYQSPAAGGRGGMTGGVEDPNQRETHRLREFANVVCGHLAHVIQEQGIQEIYISAPGKFLSVLKDHFNPAIKKAVHETMDGNYAKESPRDVLLRFRPDLKEALENLRSQENYSPKNQPPKKSK
jgi:hypothetical protein